MRTALSHTLFACLLLLSASASAQRGSPVTINIPTGGINSAGDAAELTIEVVNEGPVAVRVVGLVLEYDTPTGDTLTFEAPPTFDVEVAAFATETQTATFSTADAAGQFPNWPVPYTKEGVIGVNIEGLRAVIASPPDDPAEVQALIRQLAGLTTGVRSAERNFEERLATLSDRAAWFDTAAMEELAPQLQSGLCGAMAAQIQAANRGDDRVAAYRDAHEQLLRANMYTDCLGEEVQLLIARSMVSIDRAQDALVFINRNEDGEIPQAWRDIYIQGRYGLAGDGINANASNQFRPSIDSLGELQNMVPEQRQFQTLRDTLLRAAANHINRLIEEQKEMEALDMYLTLVDDFDTQPIVQAAADATARGVVGFGIRAAEGGHPIRANNAYVRGLEHFEGLPAWEEDAGRLQAARAQSFITSAQGSLDRGELDEAEETLAEADRRRLELDPEARNAILAGVLAVRWQEVHALIDANEFELAYGTAVGLEESEQNYPFESLGGERDATYMKLAEAIWDKYGLLGGSFAGKTMDVAEQSIERGRAADPDLADSLQGKINMSRWIQPVAMGGLLVIILLVVVMKGSWRKHMKARKLWRAGARNGDADSLDDAYAIVGMKDNAADILGEESRGHMVLMIASLYEKAGRKDQVNEWEGEWKTLSDYERPLSKDFREALEQFSAKA